MSAVKLLYLPLHETGTLESLDVGNIKVLKSYYPLRRWVQWRDIIFLDNRAKMEIFRFNILNPLGKENSFLLAMMLLIYQDFTIAISAFISVSGKMKSVNGDKDWSK